MAPSSRPKWIHTLEDAVAHYRHVPPAELPTDEQLEFRRRLVEAAWKTNDMKPARFSLVQCNFLQPNEGKHLLEEASRVFGREIAEAADLCALMKEQKFQEISMGKPQGGFFHVYPKFRQSDLEHLFDAIRQLRDGQRPARTMDDCDEEPLELDDGLEKRERFSGEFFRSALRPLVPRCSRPPAAAVGRAGGPRGGRVGRAGVRAGLGGREHAGRGRGRLLSAAAGLPTARRGGRTGGAGRGCARPLRVPRALRDGRPLRGRPRGVRADADPPLRPPAARRRRGGRPAVRRRARRPHRPPAARLQRAAGRPVRGRAAVRVRLDAGGRPLLLRLRGLPELHDGGPGVCGMPVAADGRTGRRRVAASLLGGMRPDFKPLADRPFARVLCRCVEPLAGRPADECLQIVGSMQRVRLWGESSGERAAFGSTAPTGTGGYSLGHFYDVYVLGSRLDEWIFELRAHPAREVPGPRAVAYLDRLEAAYRQAPAHYSRTYVLPDRPPPPIRVLEIIEDPMPASDDEAE
ncbi:hypothetical protein M3Y99_00819700 [Aphelenchoides fujianensis]|nr:hypothetical protein M3Y99_00819700 [Aphelenchoides fujianensis]